MTTVERRQQAAREYLLTVIKPDHTLTIVVKSVSRSGMCRRMKVCGKDMANLTGWIGELCGLSQNDQGLRVTGAGMDMCFWLADNITRSLWPDKLPEGLKGNGGDCLAWYYV